MISVDSQLHGVAAVHPRVGDGSHGALEAAQGSRGGADDRDGGEALEADATLDEAQGAPQVAGTAAPLALKTRRAPQRHVTAADEEGSTLKTLHNSASLSIPVQSPPGVGGAANGEHAERSGGGGGPPRAGSAVGVRELWNGGVEMGSSPPQVIVGVRPRQGGTEGGFFCSLCNTDFEAGRWGRMRLAQRYTYTHAPTHTW